MTRPRDDHARAATAMGLEAEPTLVSCLGQEWPDLRVRVGIATGPVVAGVLGSDRIGFDVWGDTVNTASRMATGIPAGGVQVTEATYQRIRNDFQFDRRDQVDVKGKGAMTTYLVRGLK